MNKKLVAALVIGGLALALQSSTFAGEKEKTIIGDGACAKCILKETKDCQTTITTEEGGKKVTYYLTQNSVAKEFGNQLCTDRKKVKATGTVTSVDGKMELAATKIELVKD